MLLFGVYSLVKAALRTPGAIDADVLQAVDALIKTQRTSQSGLVYETRAENSIAAAVQRGIQRFAGRLRENDGLNASRWARSELPKY